jgi:hypothetical protein
MIFGGGPGDVPAWPRKAGDKPAPDWIGDANENNADGGGCMLGRQGMLKSSKQPKTIVHSYHSYLKALA